MWYLFTQIAWLALLAFLIGLAVGWWTAARPSGSTGGR